MGILAYSQTALALSPSFTVDARAVYSVSWMGRVVIWAVIWIGVCFITCVECWNCGVGQFLLKVCIAGDTSLLDPVAGSLLSTVASDRQSLDCIGWLLRMLVLGEDTPYYSYLWECDCHLIWLSVWHHIYDDLSIFSTLFNFIQKTIPTRDNWPTY